MKIGLAADHAGYESKKKIREVLEEKGYEVIDYGTDTNDSVDYPDFAKALAKGIQNGEFERGIALCGTGIGISISLNRHKNIRAALCQTEFEARAARQHNNANVLCMGARVLGEGVMFSLIDAYLSTEFEGGRHQRRVEKIEC